MNLTLLKKELSLKHLTYFSAVLTLLTFYMVEILSLYNAETTKALNTFFEAMPNIMQSVGMNNVYTDINGFIVSYLYGFIFLVIPMIFTLPRANSLVVKYVEKGGMVTLLSAPMKRKRIILTQLFIHILSIITIILYITIFQYLYIKHNFPKELDTILLFKLNSGLLSLHVFIGSIAFFASSLCNETKHALLFGTGINVFAFIMHMLSNATNNTLIRNMTYFSLFNPTNISITNTTILFITGITLYISSCIIFCRKDLHI